MKVIKILYSVAQADHICFTEVRKFRVTLFKVNGVIIICQHLQVHSKTGKISVKLSRSTGLCIQIHAKDLHEEPFGKV